MLVRDLEATVRKSVLAIALPKIPDASFVVSVGEVLAELEREQGLQQGHTRIIGMVEDAEGLSNMNEIASAHSRMVGLIVGAEDLAVSMRMAVDDDGLYVPNVMGVAAARRAGIIPIGFIGSVADFKDPEAFRARIRRARKLGFDAAFCDPSQVAIINEEFAPTADEVEHAVGLIAEFEREVNSGLAAFTYKGRMVDLPIVDQARIVLARHQAIEAQARIVSRPSGRHYDRLAKPCLSTRSTHCATPPWRAGARKPSMSFDPHDGPMPIDYFVWVVRNAERTILVDTGFSAEAAARRKRDYLCSPIVAIGRLGITTADVRDVIITHLHYDHAGKLPAS